MPNKINKKVIIIAEAGVNHNGSILLAKKLIDASKKCGADFVKFQLYISEELVTKKITLANYQKKNLKRKNLTQYEMLKKYEFNYLQILELKKYCKQKKIKILFSVFDLKSLNNLKKLGFNYVKIPSGEITNYLLLKEIGKCNKNIILSSGISTLKEISNAVKILTKFGTKKNKITVLHCNTEYPSPIKDMNLNVLKTLKNKLGVNIGFSDHSNNFKVPILAIALGATVYEKHITLNKKFHGPDHSSSFNPSEFKKMVNSINETKIILGSSIKKPTKSELKNIQIVRKSLVASENIKQGEKFSLSNISAKRPANGINPMKIESIIGKRAKKNFTKNEKIK